MGLLRESRGVHSWGNRLTGVQVRREQVFELGRVKVAHRSVVEKVKY